MVAIQRLSFVAIASLLVAMSFEPVGIWFLAPIGYAIFISAITRNGISLRESILTSLLFSFISNLIILSWSKTFVGVTPWLLLALLQALFFIPIAISSRYKRSIPLIILVILMTEEIKSRFPFGGFGWTRIAFSQVDSPFAPFIAVLGPAGLSLITLLISFILIQRKYPAALLILGLFIGAPLFNQQSAASGDITVRAIQGGVPARGLDFNARAEEVLNRHIEQTLRDATLDDDLIVWPENAIDVDPFQSASVSLKLTNLLKEIDTPLLAGAIIDDGKLRNASVLFSTKGTAESIYIKRYLTPFGEYIPLRSLAEKISPHTERVTDFSPGDKFTNHRVKGVRISSVICYELINDGLIREASSQSSLLIVQTNSATFSGSAEGMQQLAITRLRAIENGRSVVSISTTGPSATIDRRGVVTASLLDGDIGSLQSRPALENDRTIAMQLGGFAPLFSLLLAALWFIISTRRKGSGA